MNKALIYLPLGIIAGGLVLLMFLVIMFVDDVQGAASDVPEVPGISQVVLQAYVTGAARADDISPGCEGMTWSLLAGIGFKESSHATLDGAEADENGDVKPPIFGPDLDGSGDYQHIADTDGGKWDEKDSIDRAVGPMQFIPSSWESYGQDGNGDGEKNPQNVFDAAAASVDHLCRSGGNDLTTDAGLRRAIKGYNNDDDYVNDVIDKMEEYDALHVGAAGADFTGGERVPCSNLGAMHPWACSTHEHLNDKFGAFYLSAGGYRQEEGSDHNTGEAIDYMMAPIGTRPSAERDAMAILVINYLIANFEELHVKGIIYNRHIWNPTRVPPDRVGRWEAVRRDYPHHGNITADHVDHIHVSIGDGAMN